MKTLFPQCKTCPICNTFEAVEVKDGPANFFRCGECHQAVKLDAEGHLTPWLDVWAAGQKRR